jgi:hypothetical protein
MHQQQRRDLLILFRPRPGHGRARHRLYDAKPDQHWTVATERYAADAPERRRRYVELDAAWKCGKRLGNGPLGCCFCAVDSSEGKGACVPEQPVPAIL